VEAQPTRGRQSDEEQCEQCKLENSIIDKDSGGTVFCWMQKKIPMLLIRSICVAFLIAMHSRAAASDPPMPLGKLYDIGGHRMHLYASSEGAGPSVVLEAGAGAFSIDWYLVQDAVSKFTRVCSYDGAGHAWSELGPHPRTWKQAAYDLRRLLAKAGVPGPYIMVGHSLGGPLVRVFAAEYPDDVAGMVLVDSGIENNANFINGKMVGPWDAAQPRQVPPPRDEIREDERILSKPELDGYKKFREWLGPPKIEAPFDKLPEKIQQLRLWAMSLPQSNVTDQNPYTAEESLLLFAERIRMEHPLGNKPLVVLSRKSDEQERMERQRQLSNLSGNNAFAVSDFPVHEIHLAQPSLVVDAIRAVAESVKTEGKLKLPNSGQHQ
jgi:pimeloyl-ACP methyl ester carboxylesterase